MSYHDDLAQPVPNHAALLERRKMLIRETWSAVEQGLNVQATEAFYSRLFERHPEVQTMFEHADMRIQAMKLYEVLRVSVRFLDNMEQLTPMLEDMGIRHAEAYGVVREHYNAMNEVFITILNEYFSRHFPDKLSGSLYAMDVAHAWTWGLNMISDIMASAAENAGVAPKEPGVPSGQAAVSPKSEHSYGSFGSVISMEAAI